MWEHRDKGPGPKVWEFDLFTFPKASQHLFPCVITDTAKSIILCIEFGLLFVPMNFLVPTYKEAHLSMHIYFYSFISPRQLTLIRFQKTGWLSIFSSIIYSLENCCHCHQESSIHSLFKESIRTAEDLDLPSLLCKWMCIQALAGTLLETFYLTMV